jgi:hypothetical protein
MACLVVLGMLISAGVARSARADELPAPPRDENGVFASWFRHPGDGLTLEVGAFDGGAEIADTQTPNGTTIETLNLGSGFSASIGVMLTPLWIGEYAGFGAGGFAGVKYDGLDNGPGGSVTMTRFPLGGALHVLLHIDGPAWLILRGGIQKEVGISVSSDSGLGGNPVLRGSLGGFGEGGFYGVLPVGEFHVAFSATFRYSVAHDTIAGASLSANSGGFVLGFHYNFI